MDPQLKLSLDTFILKNFKYLQKLAHKLAPIEPDDILNETILELYDIKEDKLKHLLDSHKLINYINRILYYSSTSKSSRYQQKYNKHPTSDLLHNHDNEDPQDDPKYSEEQYIKVEQARQNLEWYVNQIVELYINGDTFDKISKKTYITYCMITRRYHMAIKQIRQEVK